MNPIGYVFLPLTVGFIYYFFKNKIARNLLLLVQLLLILTLPFQNFEKELTQLLNVDLPYGMALRLDLIAYLMLVLNNTLFLITTLYTLKKPYFSPLFVLQFLSLQGIINGLFLSTDLFNIYVLFEVSTVLVTLLIMTKREHRSVYDGLIYLMTNLVSMAFFLMGIGYLYKILGVFDFISMREQLALLENAQVLRLPLAFILTGLALKAALLPVFGWLPHAHAAPSAPSAVSAILSGIFVQIGIYVLFRVFEIFSPFIEIAPLFIFLGATTAISGFVLAICQTDIKLILAFHTVSQTGLILTGIGYNTVYTQTGALYHIIAHGLFKPLLFLISGVLIEHFQTRKITEMSGLWKLSKPLSILMLTGVLSITGMPLFSGAITKILIGKSAPPMLLYLLSLGTTLSFIKFFNMLFSNREQKNGHQHLIVNNAQWLSIASISILCCLWGIFSVPILDFIFNLKIILSISGFFINATTYIFFLFLSYLIYEKWLKSNRIVQKIRAFDLSFNQMNLCLVSLFVGILTYLTWVTL